MTRPRRKTEARRAVRTPGCEHCVDESLGVGACVTHNPDEEMVLAGGPMHGQTVTVPRGAMTWVHIGSATRYRRLRVAQFVAEPGKPVASRALERDYLLHEAITDQNQGYRLLAEAVMHRWFLGGVSRPMTAQEVELDGERRATARGMAELRRNGVLPPTRRGTGLLLPGA